MYFQWKRIVTFLLLLLSVYAKGENTPTVPIIGNVGVFPLERKITGRVVDAEGKPLPGTNVVEEGNV